MVALESEGANKMTVQPDWDQKKRVFSLFSPSVVAVQLENQEVLDCSARNMNSSMFTEAHRAKIRS